MNADAQKVRSIFLAAVENHPPDEWPAYLDRACAGDSNLRGQVEVLLRAHEQPNSLLDRPAAPPAGTAEEPAGERPGTVIGPYKLLEQIGEGGMGLVFVAEQTEPVRRKVALKVIKPGMDSKQVIARFEAERQALALMDHPNIAGVLDAGATPSSRPYFVMELVKGVPITEFCDENCLTTRERLELFVQVCQAVQHAHQKGIIHRDLKPSNVLVVLHDTRPVVKVIDFGVAKAIGQQLTARTIHTGFTQMIGTPLYMSPEQAGLSGLDIDTRSDVYSLGVLLYELLTGTTPFDQDRLEQVGYDEVRRIIREEDPPRPSTRISTLGQESSTASAHRKSDPRRLSRLLRGELDWVVMKALEKDRNRRYETASAFAADVERYLHDEPVQACPPSTWYRFRKMVRRNKAAFVGSAAAALAVLVTTAGLAIGMVIVERERDAKDTALREKAAALQETEKALQQVQRQKELSEMEFDLVWEAGRRYFKAVAGDSQLKAPGFQPLRKELLGQAVMFFDFLAGGRGDDPHVQVRRADACADLAFLRQEMGEKEQALKEYQRARDIYGQLAAKFPDKPQYRLDLARSYHDAATILCELGRRSEAEPLYREAVALRKKVIQEGNTEPGVRHNLGLTHICLGLLCHELGRLPEALAYYDEALKLQRQLVKDSPRAADYREGLAEALNNRGNLLMEMNKVPEAEQAYLEAIGIQEKLVTEFSDRQEYRQQLATGHNNFGGIKGRQGQWDEAKAAFDKAIPIQEKLVADFPRVPDYRLDLARSHSNRGKASHNAGEQGEAAKSYRKALEIYEDLVRRFPGIPAYAVEFADCCTSMGHLQSQDKPAVAQPWFTKAIDALEPVLKQEPKLLPARGALTRAHWGRATVRNMLGQHDEALRDYDRAIEFDGGGRGAVLRLERALTLIDLKQYARAAAEADAVADAKDAGADVAVDAACVHAACAAATRTDAKASRRYADRAMELLRRAVGKGFKDPDRLKEEPLLDALRKRNDFQDLLKQLEATRKGPGGPES